MNSGWLNFILYFLSLGFILQFVVISYLSMKYRKDRAFFHSQLKVMDKDRLKTLNQMQFILQASQKFIEAEHENEIIQEILDIAKELTEAIGVSFVPLDDRGQPMSAQKRGEFPLPVPDAWLEYLASPKVRLDCRQCDQYESVVRTCALLKGPFAEAMGLFCFPFKLAESELGIMNIYLPEMGRIPSDVHDLLRSLVHTATLALMEKRLRRKEVITHDQLRSTWSDNNISQRDTDQRQQAEYKYKVIMEERSRLAREIHDGLAQTLGFLKLQFAQIQGYLEKNDLNRLDKAIHKSYDALSAAYQDVRESIDALRITPDPNSGHRLQDWIHQIVVEFDGTDLLNPVEVIVNEMDVKSVLPLEIHAQLIRVVQEAISNIRKHARAEHIWISCVETGGDLIIEIKDDGIGFDAGDIPGPSQHGLRGMRERAELIGADFQIISSIKQGTSVRVRLPLELNIGWRLE